MAARRQRTATGRLIGWGVLAVAVLAIVGIFVVTRMLSPQPAVPAVAVSSASSASAVSSASAEAVASSAPAVAEAAAPSSSAVAVAPVVPAKPAEPALVVIEPDKMDQATRKALVSTLIAQGIFTGVEAIGTPPKVGVTPLFQGLDPGLQRQFLAAVDGYVNNGKPAATPLQVVDATTGKPMGTYTAADGLTLL